MMHLPLFPHPSRLFLPVVTAAAGLWSGSVAAQHEQPANAQAPVAHSMAELQPGRIVMLREGSTLVRTDGVMRRSDDGRWTFIVDMPQAKDKQLELTLLPCSTLEEMQRIAESIDGQELIFEATGEVFVYEHQNYFLPTHAPHLVEARQPQKSEESDATQPDEPTSNAATEEDESSGNDDSIESIMQRLEQQSGPVARSSAEDKPKASATESASLASNGGALREGMTLVDRRGHLTRGRNGSWIFVFDADAEGLSDPPVTVLPCLLLEQMQDYARGRSNVAPMLISGRIFQYESRRYVLPTLYRIPRTRTPIVP